jgi:phosphatidylserine/phosphatidylglycerophosphate/cardiolipin synthase-like enzyme
MPVRAPGASKNLPDRPPTFKCEAGTTPAVPRRRRALVATLVVLSALVGAAGAASGNGHRASGASPPDGADAAASVTGPTVEGPAGGEAAIVAVYADTVRDGDAGEHVVVRLDRPGNWTLSDGETTVALPANATGELALAADPAAARDLTTRRVVAAPGLALSNAGERLVLRRNGTVVARAVYEDAETAARYRPGEGFVPAGTTDVAVGAGRPATVTAFTLPDAPDAALGPIANATDRVLLAGYTLTSQRVVDALLAAAERGATVRVLVEAAPVGGATERQAAALDRLADTGVAVRVLDGPATRYAYHHPKYAVVDDRAVVLSENWKPSGVGGRGSRGWGAVVDDGRVAAHLGRVFAADFGARAATPWERYRRGRSFEPVDPATGEHPSRRAPERLRAASVRVLVAPDNAERALVDLLDGAEESILVQQVRVEPGTAPLRALERAADRGVTVRLLLASAWYVREENRRLAGRLNARADERDWDLEVRLVESGGRFDSLHNKGVVVDGEHAVVGSLNWNDHALRENREVALLLSGERVAGYYAAAFRDDWAGDGGGGLPVGLLAAVAVALAVVARYARERIAFGR